MEVVVGELLEIVCDLRNIESVQVSCRMIFSSMKNGHVCFFGIVAKDATTICASQVSKDATVICMLPSSLSSKAESFTIVHVSNEGKSNYCLLYSSKSKLKPGSHFGHMEIRDLIPLKIMSKPTIMPTRCDLGMQFK